MQDLPYGDDWHPSCKFQISEWIKKMIHLFVRGWLVGVG